MCSPPAPILPLLWVPPTQPDISHSTVCSLQVQHLSVPEPSGVTPGIGPPWTAGNVAPGEYKPLTVMCEFWGYFSWLHCVIWGTSCRGDNRSPCRAGHTAVPSPLPALLHTVTSKPCVPDTTHAYVTAITKNNIPTNLSSLYLQRQAFVVIKQACKFSCKLFSLGLLCCFIK